MTTSGDWVFWALLSAVFAAATAILAKIGLEGIDSDVATLVRTVVIGVVLAIFAVIFLGERPSVRDGTGIAMVGAGVLLLSLRR